MIKHIALAAVAAVTMTAGTGAEASTVIFKPGMFGPPAGYTLFADFDSSVSQSVVTGDNFFFATGNVSGLSAGPTGDTTPYLAVLGGGIANISFAEDVRSFSFDYSTVDTYNTLTISYADGGFSDVSGDDILKSGQSSGSASGSFIVNGDGRLISGIALKTLENSFEVDNLAVSQTLGTVPEPATWALMVVGFGLVAVSMRRRSSATVAA